MVFFRSGGLGDFILTLPLLKCAYHHKHQVILYARSHLLNLVSEGWDWLETKDLDQLVGKPPPCTNSSVMVSFWKDPNWPKEMKAAGAVSAFSLDPRPARGKHFVIQALEKLNLEMTENLLSKPLLGDRWSRQKNNLWVHPGSGGKKKNLPIEYFVLKAKEWLDLNSNHQVIVSFGNADAEVFLKFKKFPIAQDRRVKITQPETIKELVTQLTKQAGRFIGNDSGPSHLAANLGIPVEVNYRCTEAEVWRPTGPRVKTYLWDSDSSKIL